jgi:hypothetical protein
MSALSPKDPLPNPMDHPDEQQSEGADGSPKFGRLLIVLAIAVMMIVGITFGSQAYFS